MASSASSGSDSQTYVEGTVTRSTGSWYDVRVGDRTIPCRVRGKFRLTRQNATNPVAVGDRVTLRLNEEDQTGFITEIHERNNKLSRRAAGHRTGEEHVMVSNVDRVWIVQAARRPRINASFIDRLLVASAVHDLSAGLILNKMDLLRPSDRPEVTDLHLRYADLGYPVIPTSATENYGLEWVRTAFQNRTSVLAGPSGTGKSSLLNALDPTLSLKTGEVSASTDKGTHTTTHAELLSLPNGGFVVDTPGIREFGVRDVHPQDLAHFFPDLVPYVNACKFPDCTHDHEPGCAVKEAVDEAHVHPARYESYLRILASLQTELERSRP